MLHVTPKRFLRLVIVTLVLILQVLSTSCGGTVPTPSPPLSTRSSFPSSVACNQPMPSPAPGKITFAGLGYTPYHAGQNPNTGVIPSEEIQADMLTLATLTGCIRLYSSTGSTPAILDAANAAHIGVVLDISLNNKPQDNEKEVQAGIQLAANSAVRSIIVGNEVLLRKDMSEDALRTYIRRVRTAVQEAGKKNGRMVPVSVAEGYHEWLTHPELAADVDFITIHIYPFWETTSIDTAMQSLAKAYTSVKNRFPQKQVIIGETGWPSEGPPHGAAIPNSTNQARYVKGFTAWAQQNNLPYFYFEAFDEGWKTQEEGFGTHWGLYQEDGKLKDALKDVLPDANGETLHERSYRDVYVGGLNSGLDIGVVSSSQVHNWLKEQNGTLRLSYPANQEWGVMFIIVHGSPPPDQLHPSLDLSAYQSLVFDMRAETEGQCVSIGIKDRTQPDDGSEIKKQECLTTQWTMYKEPLSTFSDVDLTHLYIVFEVAFEGKASITLELKNIRYAIDATVIVPPAQATAVVSHYPFSNKLMLNDPLRDNSKGYQWDEYMYSDVACQFTGGAYHVAAVRSTTVQWNICIAKHTNFSNFTYQVEMTIIKGNRGGIVFRRQPNRSSVLGQPEIEIPAFSTFTIDTHGNYEIMNTDPGYGTSFEKKGSSAAIKTGLYQFNLIAVVVRDSEAGFYVNGWKVASMANISPSTGQIGVIAMTASEAHSSVEAVYHNAKVWEIG